MISASHIRGYLDLPEKVEIVALCDAVQDSAERRLDNVIKEAKNRADQTDSSRLQQLWQAYDREQIQVFADYRQLLDLPGLDAVSLCTPPFVHQEMTTAAAQAGKHVFCEKPMSRIATEAKVMANACQAAGVKLGYQSGGTRLGAVNTAIRDYISSGQLGDVYYGRQTSFRVRGRPGIDMPNFSPWFLNSSFSGGGSIYDIGVYQIDRLLYLLGDPQPKTISGVAYRGVEPHYDGDGVYDVDEQASVLIRFSNGMSFTFEVGWISNLDDISEGFSIFGSKGAFRNERLFVEAGQWEMDDRGNRRRYHGKLMEKPLEIPDIPAQSKFENFIDACIEDKQPISCGEDGVKVMEIMSGALLSAKLGREISVEELYQIEGLRAEPVPGWPI